MRITSAKGGLRSKARSPARGDGEKDSDRQTLLRSDEICGWRDPKHIPGQSNLAEVFKFLTLCNFVSQSFRELNASRC